MNNKVSIITPSYNSAKFIGRTIESVLSQSYSDWEMIIVDDCSRDKSVEVIKKYLDDRIRLINLTDNRGAAFARNKALEVATGRFIAFLDSDDLWKSRKLEIQLNFMLENNYAFTFSSYECISEEGNSLNKVIVVPQVVSYGNYLKNTIIGCLTVIIDKSKVGDFRMPEIESSHDMALWLLIMKRGFKAFGLNKVLSKYRLVDTSNTANKYKAAKDVWKVYREIEGLSFIKSIYCFVFYAFNAVYKRI